MSNYNFYTEFEKLLKSLDMSVQPMGIISQLDKLQPPTSTLYSTDSERMFSEIQQSLSATSTIALTSSIHSIVTISESLKRITPPHSPYESVIDSIKAINTSSSVVSFLTKYRVPLELSYPSNFISSVGTELLNAVSSNSTVELLEAHTNYFVSIFEDVDELISSTPESKPEILNEIISKLADYIDEKLPVVAQKVLFAYNILTLINTIYSGVVLENLCNSHDQLSLRVAHLEEVIEGLDSVLDIRFSYLQAEALTKYVNEQNTCIYSSPSVNFSTVGKLPLGTTVILEETPPENGFSKIECFVPATGKFVSGWIESKVLESH